MFEKGRNKTGGKKKGTKNKTTLIFENLLLEHRAELLNKAIEMANAGNERILIKLLDKIVPTLNSIENKGINGTRNIRILVENPTNTVGGDS